MTSLRPGAAPSPAAGGLDLDLPGAGVRLRGTRWPGTGTPVLLWHGLTALVAGLVRAAADEVSAPPHGEGTRP